MISYINYVQYDTRKVENNKEENGKEIKKKIIKTKKKRTYHILEQFRFLLCPTKKTLKATDNRKVKKI